MFERTLKVEAKPWPQDPYVTKDLGSIRLNSTTYDTFVQNWGDPSGQEDVTLSGYENPCRRYSYPWGYVTFQRVGGTQYLAEVYCTTADIKGPRSTQVGQSEADVVGKFQDFGQVTSPSGNRGLYSGDDGTGRIYRNEDGTRTIRYIAYTADGHMWQLDYLLNSSGTVRALYQTYLP